MGRKISQAHVRDQRKMELEKELMLQFLGKQRSIPKRPAYSRMSTLIIRKELLPFYYAIYDHDLGRFVELQYRIGKDGPLTAVPVPMEMQPPVTTAN